MSNLTLCQRLFDCLFEVKDHLQFNYTVIGHLASTGKKNQCWQPKAKYLNCIVFCPGVFSFTWSINWVLVVVIIDFSFKWGEGIDKVIKLCKVFVNEVKENMFELSKFHFSPFLECTYNWGHSSCSGHTFMWWSELSRIWIWPGSAQHTFALLQQPLHGCHERTNYAQCDKWDKIPAKTDQRKSGHRPHWRDTLWILQQRQLVTNLQHG